MQLLPYISASHRAASASRAAWSSSTMVRLLSYLASAAAMRSATPARSPWAAASSASLAASAALSHSHRWGALHAAHIHSCTVSSCYSARPQWLLAAATVQGLSGRPNSLIAAQSHLPTSQQAAEAPERTAVL